jgi:ribose transport system permease protein
MTEIQAAEDAQQPRRLFGMTLGGFIGRFGALFGLIIVVVVLAIFSPVFLTTDNLSNIGRQLGVNALLSVGMLVVIITAGIDLSVGSILGLSMCVLAWMAITQQINPYVSMIACLVVGVGVGLTNGLLLTRLHLPHPFIATLGTMNVARGLALIITGASPISGFDRAGAPQVLWLGSGSIGPIPVVVLLVLIVYVIFHLLLSNTALGRHIYAVGGNTSAARLSGIDVDKTLLIVYSLSGLMAGLAALVLAGRTNSGYPNAGAGYELDAIAAVIIGGASFSGGVGTVWGTLIGVLLMAVLRNGLVLLGVPSEWQIVAIGFVIIVAVYIDVLRQRARR